MMDEWKGGDMGGRMMGGWKMQVSHPMRLLPEVSQGAHCHTLGGETVPSAKFMS